MTETEPTETIEQRKRRAAQAAVALVQPGMRLGIGAGTTTALAAAQIAERVAAGALSGLVCVPCSSGVERQLRALGLEVATLAEQPRLDLTIDGADEVDPALALIKGAGGALLREKMVAQASAREVIIVDDSKLSPRLGTRARLPVEVVPFGWRAEEQWLRGLGADPVLRLIPTGPFVTDEGNFILDCRVAPIEDVAALARQLDARAGLVAHGLFVDLATEVIVAGAELRHLRLASPR